MSSTETWIRILNVVTHTENDGPGFLNNGPEATEETYTMEELIKTHGRSWVADQLRKVAANLDMEERFTKKNK